jgi:hypothetical protein
MKTPEGRGPIVWEMSLPRADSALPRVWHPRDEAPVPAPPASPEEDLARKQARREAKLVAEAVRLLDPWERYRALTDAVEEGIDLAEMADRKVRFALVVMAGINVGLFVLTTRPELVALGNAPLQGWLGFYLLAYALVGAYFLLQAVEALRPRTSRPSPGAASAAGGLRDPDEVPRHDVDSYERAWRDVRFDQLNGELARRNYGLAVVNQEKYAALGRLYNGLRVLALLFGGLVVMAALSTLYGGGRP